MPDRVVQNGDHLIVDALQVGIGIRLLALIPEGQQFILPGDDILGVDLADDPLPEGRDQLLPDHVFLSFPGACFQAGTDILFIQFAEGREGHIQIRGALQFEAALPVLGLLLGLEAALALLVLVALPVVIPDHDVPGIVFLILMNRHIRFPPFLRFRIFSGSIPG